ncbi:Imm7 family immunity protein [Streptomyces macrosporus]
MNDTSARLPFRRRVRVLAGGEIHDRPDPFPSPVRPVVED